MKYQVIHLPAKRLTIFLLAISIIFLPGFATLPAAKFNGQELAVSSNNALNKIEASNFASFTDDLITRQFNQYHIAGAVVSIVKDGKIEFSKGYGYADAKEQTPVSPDETMFRIGSISKLFTWTAVMQLVEQGKIDLNADINTYLPDFKIPDTFPDPITMINLLSHTAGFEERITGTESRSPEEMFSLHDYLERYMPDRVRPTGKLITYSNYGTALAGYIVEVVSGLPFEQYVEMNIFQPLSMSYSTFRQPLPANFESHLATSYSYNGEFIPGSFTYMNLSPAGGMSSTAYDMANFLIAHLQDGRFEDNQILMPDTARQMHSHLFSNDERLDGMAYGFLEWNFNGQRVLWHNGDIGNWHSGLAIIPNENLGFFVGYNSNDSLQAVNEFYSSFMYAFFPVKETGDPPTTNNPALDMGKLTGEYRSTRSIYNHVERITAFPGNKNVSVVVDDGTLSISGYQYVQKDTLVYSPVDWADTVIFKQDGSSKKLYMLFNSNQLFAYEKVSWYETSTFNLLLFIVCYLLLLSALLAAFIGIFRRSKSKVVPPKLPRAARIWALILSAIFLLAPIAITSYTSLDYKYAFPFYMVLVLVIIFVASILVAGPLVFTILAWSHRFWNRASRLHYTLITSALLGMVWLMYYWRILGFRY